MPSAKDEEIEEGKLVAACLRGSAHAHRTFVDRYLGRVPDYVRRIDRSPSFGDEVRQEVARRLLLPGEDSQAPRLALYSGRGSLHGFVRVAAMRIALNLKRSKSEKNESLSGRNAAVNPDDPEKLVLKKRDAATFRRAFEGAISNLDVDARNVLRLHYVDGLSLEEVAAAYGVGRATAARWIAKAKATVMQKTLDDLVSSRGKGRSATEWLEIVQSQFGSSLFECLGGKARSRR